MKVKKILLFIFLGVSFLGITSFALAGNNIKKTEDRKLKNFEAIKISSGIDLFLSMGNSESVKVGASDGNVKDIVTEVRNGTLHIYLRKTNLFNFFNWGSNKGRKAYVTVTGLKQIHASAGSDVKSENTLKGDVLDLKISSGSGLILDVFYKDISLNASSGSNAKLSGKSKTFNVSASSGSNIHARNLEVMNCSAKASSGANIHLHATAQINARASSGANIRYSGNPRSKEINNSSGGSISSR